MEKIKTKFEILKIGGVRLKKNANFINYSKNNYFKY
jgi:hypothetical protein